MTERAHNQEKLHLPAPQADQGAYRATLERGFKRFPKRLENYQKYQNCSRAKSLDYLPVKMDYEIISRCNFRCIMCRINDWKQGSRAADMRLDDFKRSLDSLYSLVEIKLQGVGEPLLHPHVFDMIHEAVSRDIWTRVNVNGSLLNVKDNYKRLIDSDPGEIQISIDGATKRVFEGIRRGAHFEQIVENATLLNSYARQKGVLKTRSWTVVQKDNIDELEEIVRLADKMEFRRVTFSIALSFWGLSEWLTRNASVDVSGQFTQARAESLIELGRSLGVEVTFWDGSSKYKLKGDKKDLCAWIFGRAFISSDMRIVPCCVLSDPGIADFGDAREFTRIWDGQVYQDFREAHFKGVIPDFCKQCYEETDI